MLGNLKRRWQAIAVVVGLLPGMALVAAACGSSTAGTSTPNPTGTASAHESANGGLITATRNAKLGSTILVDRQGMTLYTLSAETGGRFICTKSAMVPGGSGSCLSLWRPLTVAGGVTLTGTIPSLGVIKRPDGAGDQVSYQGHPLYSFKLDHAPGQVTGNGFRDVGIWRPAAVGAAQSQPAPSSGGGSGYGGY